MGTGKTDPLAAPNIREQEVCEPGKDTIYCHQIEQFIVTERRIQTIENILGDPDRHKEYADEQWKAQYGHQNVTVVRL